MNEWEFQRYKKDNFRKVPDSPGVYKYLNKEGVIIYVGKAKNLRKRVASYFTRAQQESLKTLRLVREISEIEFVIVNTEYEALVLEDSLIKENQPKYNIMLKDGKSYPFICLKNERFPRVFSTRQVKKNDGEYFGPFTSVRAMNNVLNLVKKFYKIRTCSFNLSEKNVTSGKFKVCLEYHINNCKGPCESHQGEDDYNNDIAHIRHILKGNLQAVKLSFKELIEQATRHLHFEEAQVFKERLESLDNFQSKSLVANPKISDTDVFTIKSDEDKSFINYMKIDEGSIKLSETIEVKRKLDESENEILPLVIFNLRKRFSSTNATVLTNLQAETWEPIEISVPLIGDKKKLVDLSLKNVEYYRKESLNNTPSISDKILAQLKEDLSLENTPHHIECFDNSNIQGSNPVASMVCFKNARPSKRDYRKFKIKTVVGADDFGSMVEIVTRRYKRLRDEKEPFPDLIVVDGGKGQLSTACDALKNLGLYGEIPIVGIAKKLEEIYLPNDPYPLHINKKSMSLKLIQQIRDEAHRFAITFHRDKRSKGQIVSKLDSIEGIGSKTKDKLLHHFKSVQRIKAASITELAQFIGLSKAQIVFTSLNKKGDLD
ncbi:MAG: excinuclease ABC subunit C [Cytophagales bacterium]|nr:excinuclease ABC subunit C [Cytophagales bacterium]